MTIDLPDVPDIIGRRVAIQPDGGLSNGPILIGVYHPGVVYVCIDDAGECVSLDCLLSPERARVVAATLVKAATLAEQLAAATEQQKPLGTPPDGAK